MIPDSQTSSMFFEMLESGPLFPWAGARPRSVSSAAFHEPVNPKA